jgi:hypothetical protein
MSKKCNFKHCSNSDDKIDFIGSLCTPCHGAATSSPHLHKSSAIYENLQEVKRIRKIAKTNQIKIELGETPNE